MLEKIKKEILKKLKKIIKKDKEDGLKKVTSSYVSYILKTVTSELSLLDIEKQELWFFCLKEIDIEYTYSNNFKGRIKNTARKWTKTEAEAHGHKYLDENPPFKKI